MCPAHQSFLVPVNAGQDAKPNENPGLSTGPVSSWAHFPRTLMSEAGQWLFGRFHNNVESGTDIPSWSQLQYLSTSGLQYLSPLRFSSDKLSAYHSFPCIINGSTTVLCFCHGSLTSQENKTRLHQHCGIC